MASTFALSSGGVLPAVVQMGGSTQINQECLCRSCSVQKGLKDILILVFLSGQQNTVLKSDTK